MLERLDLMKEGPHYLKGESLRRYRAIIKCGCRRRVAGITMLATSVHATSRCSLCGDVEEVDLTKAMPFISKLTKHRPFYQDTQCRVCAAKYSFSFEQEAVLEVSCPHCQTLTRKRRKLKEGLQGTPAQIE